MSSGFNDTDLSSTDWYRLRDVVLAACCNESLPEIPRHLEAHKVVQLVREGKKDEAGQLLCPKHPEKWFIALSKS
ncbi:MAG: hypothetical protein QM808_02965 [Steroidobacteraceae bacterium]